MPEIKDISECPDCGSTNIVHKLELEQIICRDCGLIFEPFVTAAEKIARAKRTKAKRAKPKKGKKKRK